jgi:putative endonuclease
MHYVYILQSYKDGLFYIGYSSNLRRRIKEHQSGEVLSTKPRRPFQLIFYEAYTNEDDARRRETYFKSTKGKTTLRMMLRNTLSNAIETS